MACSWNQSRAISTQMSQCGIFQSRKAFSAAACLPELPSGTRLTFILPFAICWNWSIRKFVPSETGQTNSRLPSQIVPPHMPAALQQAIGALWAPRSGKIVGKYLRFLRRPGFENGRIERPIDLDAVAVREKRLVAQHRVQQQPLIAVGAGFAECRGIIEVHVHWAHVHIWSGGHLGPETKRDSLIRLDANSQQVGLDLLAGPG